MAVPCPNCHVFLTRSPRPSSFVLHPSSSNLTVFIEDEDEDDMRMLLAEQSRSVLFGIKWLQVISLFAQAHKFDGQAQFFLDGHDHATFAGAIEFGNNQTG